MLDMFKYKAYNIDIKKREASTKYFRINIQKCLTNSQINSIIKITKEQGGL